MKKRSPDWPAWTLFLVALLFIFAFALTADGQTTPYPAVQPDAAQRVLLRSIGPVECGPPINLTFETLEGFRAWLWPQEVDHGHGAWSILRGHECVIPGWEDRCWNAPVVTQGRAGSVLFDALKPARCDGREPTWSARSKGPAGGHSSDVVTGWYRRYGDIDPTVGQWMHALANYVCPPAYCVDRALVGSVTPPPPAPEPQPPVPPPPPQPPPPGPPTCTPYAGSSCEARCTQVGKDREWCLAAERESGARLLFGLCSGVCRDGGPEPDPEEPPTPEPECWEGRVTGKFRPGVPSTGRLEVELFRVDCPPVEGGE